MGRCAVTGSIEYPNNLPLQGSATWRGDMVGLNMNNREVRGGAALTMFDLSNPLVDVILTPLARPVMQWNDLRVVNSGFLQKSRSDDYIAREFYG